MKTVLILSFDLIRGSDNPITLSIGSILAYAQKQEGYGDNFETKHLSINLCKVAKQESLAVTIDAITKIYDLNNLHIIAIGCYVWSEYFTNPLILALKKLGFSGKIVLGGYQIAYGAKQELLAQYPAADAFIMGYGEKSLIEVIMGNHSTFLKNEIDFTEQPSPYLNGTISIHQNENMLRLETKRGCPYRCTFCAHRDLVKNKVYKHDLDKVFAELALFKEKNVQKVNVLDPVFNMGKDHISIMHEIVRTKMNTHFTFQSRFEQIKSDMGAKFLELIAQANTVLEFGLQTAIEVEQEVIERKNNINIIKETMHQLNKMGINYEVSLIYGLPHQTVDSFKKSIEFVINNGCPKVVAFPLMLLKGTELFKQKAQWNLQEEIMGDFDIPTVISSNSFTRDDWYQMEIIAENLSQHNRF